MCTEKKKSESCTRDIDDGQSAKMTSTKTDQGGESAWMRLATRPFREKLAPPPQNKPLQTTPTRATEEFRFAHRDEPLPVCVASPTPSIDTPSSSDDDFESRTMTSWRSRAMLGDENRVIDVDWDILLSRHDEHGD